MTKRLAQFLLHWYLIADSLIYCYCVTTTFSTVCNSSHFDYCENLIGSIHTYAPTNVKILVSDSGLTTGQRQLLSLYQNVKLIQLTNSNIHGKLIDATDELFNYESERFISRLDWKSPRPKLWPHIDSIRKRTKLAVVVPIIRSQLMSFASQMNRSIIYTPCKSMTSTDLILYHNEKSDSSLTRILLEMLHQYDSITHKCYRSVRILATSLEGMNNTYLVGSGIMWRELIDSNSKVSLYSLGYTHFFMMETDTWPVRSFWLEKIHQQISDGRRDQHFSTAWWMTGSVYRGSKQIGPGYIHINGNALYHLSSNLIAFVHYFWQIYERYHPTGYDYAITYLLMQDMRYQSIVKRTLHKFRYSDFIQNCWQTGCYENKTQYLLDYPETFFIHGGKRSPVTSLDHTVVAFSAMSSFSQSNFSFHSVLLMHPLAFVFVALLIMHSLAIKYWWRYYLLTRRWRWFPYLNSKRTYRTSIVSYTSSNRCFFS
jgi:hypothetical protein